MYYRNGQAQEEAGQASFAVVCPEGIKIIVKTCAICYDDIGSIAYEISVVKGNRW
jgi:hypothetical protein